LFIVSPHLARAFHGTYLLPLGYSLEGAAITLLLLWLVRRPDTPVGKAFNAPVVRHLGVISYSLYIWQQLFLAPPSVNASSLWDWLFKLICCLAVAEGSYWGIERPFLSLKRYFNTGPREWHPPQRTTGELEMSPPSPEKLVVELAAQTAR
jgi:peptidoglycan/LPS O-acetylase OafA/YrhL